MEWTCKGKTYRARRDKDGFIYISELVGSDPDDQNSWFLIGHSGYDFSLSFEKVPILATRLGVWEEQQYEHDSHRSA